MLCVSAPAKVNLHLAVGGLRPDGYHQLTSVFHTLDLSDTLSFREAPGLSLECDVDLGLASEHNLAHRAAVEMGAAFGADPDVSIAITKRIPHGAGLGGGSADAAAVIAALATLWGASPRDERCIDVARSLGADVAFFLVPGGVALMTGRGDVIEAELEPFPGAPVVLVRPPVPVSTAAAYSAFDKHPIAEPSPDAVIAALAARDLRALGASLANNLAQASIAVAPEVRDALEWLRAAPGVTGAEVSGSGSAVFAICESHEVAESAACAAADRGWWSLVTALGGSGVAVNAMEE